MEKSRIKLAICVTIRSLGGDAPRVTTLMLRLDDQGGQEKTCSAGKPGWGQDHQQLPI